MADLYISGGITGVKDHKKLFQEAETSLLQAGYDVVINPVKVEAECTHSNKGSHTWQCFMRYDIVAMMNYCNAIALLPNWFASRGANVELTLARGLGFQIGTIKQWIERAK